MPAAAGVDLSKILVEPKYGVCVKSGKNWRNHWRSQLLGHMPGPQDYAYAPCFSNQLLSKWNGISIV